MEKYLLLSYPLVSRLWGSPYFKETLNITTKDDIGEMWSCSAYPNCESIVLNGCHKGKTLSQVYKEYPNLFNNPKCKEFPILVKIIMASKDLSIQVHPDDSYANKFNERGKTEGWLILDKLSDSKIIYGTNTNNKDNIIKAIDNNNIESVLNKVDVNVGEFYPIDAGTIHGLSKDILIVEVQQSSDLTYRIYDYNRKDKNGNLRELHVDKAKDVIKPFINKQIKNYFDFEDSTIWDNEFFNIHLYKVNNTISINKDIDYQIVTILEGNFVLDNNNLSIGNSFIVLSNSEDIVLKGNGKIIVTKSKE